MRVRESFEDAAVVSISDAMDTSCLELLDDEVDIEDEELGVGVELDDVLDIDDELEPLTASLDVFELADELWDELGASGRDEGVNDLGGVGGPNLTGAGGS